MQTPKSSTKSSSEGSRKISFRSASSDTTQKISSRSSPNQPSIRTPKNGSPIIAARKSPKSPISELQKKRPGRVLELETQISQLQDALKTVKDQLISSESWKDQAKQDAQESRSQLLAMASKLEESQNLLARSSSENTIGIRDLENLTHASDETWKLKLEAAKKLHSADLDALGAAIDEIGQLQVKLDGKVKSEANQTEQAESANAEVHSLKETMAKTLSLVETMKNELKDCRNSESRAQAKFNDDDEEIIALKSEVGKLKSDAETANTRFNQEQSRRTMEIANAYELVEEIKFSSRVKESELEEELKKSKADIEELKANLMDKETELQGICEENEDLNSKLKNSLTGKRENELENEIKNLKHDFHFLKSKLMATETELHEKSDENEKLKLEIKKMECRSSTGTESETGIKVDHLVGEIENGNGKVARVVEQLEAAQAANYELEAELRKLKVQSDQWRKAAEAAAAIISAGNNTNRKLTERTGSMDNCSPGRNIGSPYGEDIDDDSDEFLKKKNGNVLTRIGVLWKKPQNKRQ